MRSATEQRPRKAFYQGDPFAGPPPPELEAILDRFRGRADSVIAVLQAIQETYGYLPRRPLGFAARELGVPLARLYGVATFYNQFHFSPPGKYVIQVCRGTACHVAASSELLAAISASLGIGEDESTEDGIFSLQTVACLGCCSLAPVMVVGGDVHGKMAPERLGELLERYRAAAREEGA